MVKSAMRAAIRMDWPNRPRVSSCSLRTGITTPSEVVDMISAIIQGLCTRPRRRSVKPTMVERASVSRKLKRLSGTGPSVRRRCLPAADRLVRAPRPGTLWARSMFRLAKSISIPARNIRNTKPNSAKSVSSASSLVTQPNPLRPTTIPARISPTTIGSRRRWKRISTRGTLKARAMTISRGVKPASASIGVLQWSLIPSDIGNRICQLRRGFRGCGRLDPVFRFCYPNIHERGRARIAARGN